MSGGLVPTFATTGRKIVFTINWNDNQKYK